MAESKHVCPDLSIGMLPMIVDFHADEGNVTQVLKWIENGGDLNACNMSGHTVVHIAIENDHENLLNALLKLPQVHINQRSNCSHEAGMDYGPQFTPLELAVTQGSVKSVAALLSSPSTCQIDLKKHSILIYNALLEAAKGGSWRIFEIVINAGFPLKAEEVETLLPLAAKTKESVIIKLLFERAMDINANVYSTLPVIYANEMWTCLGADKYFQNAVENRHFQALKVLTLALDMKDWVMLEALLRMLNGAVKINISLAEAVLGKKLKEVEKMLSEDQVEDEVMHGALLVAAIGGTKEEIVEKLFNQRKDYPQPILNYVLSIAYLNANLELLPTLLQRASFSYKTLVHTQGLHPSGTDPLIGRALKKLAMETIPIDEICEKVRNE